MFLHLNSFDEDVTEKERIKRLNFDYRHNGNLWDYHGKFHRWIQEIDNEFARQKLNWLNQDIEEGFASYYFKIAYFQQHIDQSWINEVCLKHYSNDRGVNYSLSTLSIKENSIIIPREDYQNLYYPIDVSDLLNHPEKHGMYFYDLRVDNLYRQKTAEVESIDDKTILFHEILQEFARSLENKEEKQWRGIEIDLKGFEPAPYHIPVSVYEETGQPTINYESIINPNFLLYSPEPYIKLGQLYFDGFEYQEHLSDKAFKVFTKSINDNYQWALSLFSKGGQVWHSFVPLLMIIRTNQNRPIKPKHVVYQELYLFMGGYYFIGGHTEGRALQIKKFNYINRYVNRYIDWMQDKVMAVIESND